MEVVIADEYTLAELAADAIERLLRTEAAPVIGLATGSSPLRIYDELTTRHKNEGLSFAHAQAFMLDEYVGIADDHPQRYRNVIDTEIATRVDFAEGAVHGPDGSADDLAAASADYERKIVGAGGIDLQILGIGTDGHVAFNEPGSSLASRTRVKSLTQQTRMDNARFFDGDVEQVPKLCLTQGMGTIMEAKHLVLVATGGNKAEAVHQMIEGPISAMWPATVLQMHQHVTVLLDEAAASRLQLGDYYRHAYENKPEWQNL
ncbi:MULTISPECIES: glucosamine-6-phosphate deaminase [Brevibacterium]|jgi:glucosamine-6-phosphate deaminase|uniref:Glucosamine-6-phosphate deaminase n=2 Tax=Brevibacterium TaxID=1696 RepID=A0A0B9A2B2_BRELN|nr:MULTISPECIES: glucosamine-6-phosphate deaminase [Brevibacterium]AMT92928.1 glucosamine-6-phosphate deaminase [Brevibacterium linens]KHS52789.1 Glucosamine-6-phosphate deaminase [Brevibacterium linens]